MEMCRGKVQGNVDMETDCYIKWITRHSNNFSDIADKILDMPYWSRTTFTSLALTMAQQDFSQGRPEAASVVVVLTDGVPNSQMYTGQAAHKVKFDEEGNQKGTLVFVPIGSFSSAQIQHFNSWASYPAKDHVVEVGKFDQLGLTATINKIVTDFCTDVEIPSTYEADELVKVQIGDGEVRDATIEHVNNEEGRLWVKFADAGEDLLAIDDGPASNATYVWKPGQGKPTRPGP